MERQWLIVLPYQKKALLLLWAAVAITNGSSQSNKNSFLVEAVQDFGEWLDLDALEEGLGSAFRQEAHTTKHYEDVTQRLRRREKKEEAHHHRPEEETAKEAASEKQSQRSTLVTLDIQTKTCRVDGLSSQPFRGRDSPERLLLREGILTEMPASRCDNANRKNVILAIGDGMGYEMARAGAIARQVIDELERLGCNTTVGCPNNTIAKAAFRNRNLSDYYTEGRGSGLSFQSLNGFSLVTNSPVMLTKPFPGNHNAPVHSLLGNVDKHKTGLGELKLNECGNPLEFDPRDITEGGHMVLWHDDKGGMYPWHDDYYDDIDVGTTTEENETSNNDDIDVGTTTEEIETSKNESSSTVINISIGSPSNNTNTSTVGDATNSNGTNTTSSTGSNATNGTGIDATNSTTGNTFSSTSVFHGVSGADDETTISKRRGNSNFDPTYIMQHAVDSAASGTAIATGQKVANKMIGLNLYEEEVKSILADAMGCGMAGGVVSSVPVLHATPAAFIAHSNARDDHEELRRSFRQVNPTLAMGTCSDKLHPSESDLESMRNGPLSSQWTLFEVKGSNTTAENFFDGIDALHPDGNHIAACLGTKKTTPYRGVDSSYTKRRCNDGSVKKDSSGNPIGTRSKSELCDKDNPPRRKKQIPHMTKSVKEALKFLSKNEQGMFLVYEQGDIDVAAHANHMDDMLGTLLDFDDSVAEIIKFIEENGGWDKHALYVTADHDHYLTLLPHFPEVLANMLIAGESHEMTPEAYTNLNPWSTAIKAGRHNRISEDKSQIDHLRDFSTWTEEDIDRVGHFWGPRGAGGNGWGSHSTRPVPVYYQGDGQCIDRLEGKDYSVLGRQVKGSPGKIDQVHLHACMTRRLFGY